MHKEREYNSVMYHLWYVHCFAQSLTMHLVINVLTTVFSYELFYYTTGLMSYCCYVVKPCRDSLLNVTDFRSDFSFIFFNITDFFFFLQLSSLTVYLCYLILKRFLILACSSELNYYFFFFFFDLFQINRRSFIFFNI